MIQNSYFCNLMNQTSYETYMTAKADTKEDEKYSTFVLYKAIKKVQLWTTKRLNLNKS